MYQQAAVLALLKDELMLLDSLPEPLVVDIYVRAQQRYRWIVFHYHPLPPQNYGTGGDTETAGDKA
jgi:hypothetical protein